MRATPERYTAAATELKSRGVRLPVILETLQADEATALDLVRVVKAIEHVDVGTAHRLINETGILPEPLGLVVAVPDDDPWYDLLFPTDGDRPGKSDPGGNDVSQERPHPES